MPDETEVVAEAMTEEEYQNSMRLALAVSKDPEAQIAARVAAAEVFFHAMYEKGDRDATILMYVAMEGPLVISGPVSATREDAEMMYDSLVGEAPEDNPDAAVFSTIFAVREVMEALASKGSLAKFEGVIDGTPVIFLDIPSRVPSPVSTSTSTSTSTRQTLGEYVYASDKPNGTPPTPAEPKKKKKKSMAGPLILTALAAAGLWKVSRPAPAKRKARR